MRFLLFLLLSLAVSARHGRFKGRRLGSSFGRYKLLVTNGDPYATRNDNDLVGLCRRRPRLDVCREMDLVPEERRW